METIRGSKSIWDFERRRIPGKPHFAVTSTPFFYCHVVDKGSWPQASRLLRQACLGGELGTRRVHGKLKSGSLLIERLRWLLFGHSIC
jgi:hypothetical protein